MNQSNVEDKNNNQSNKNKDGDIDDNVFNNNKNSEISNFSPKRRTGNVEIPSYRERDKLNENDVKSRVGQHNSDSLSRSNKINDIRNRFEQQEEQHKPRTPVLGAKVDVKARKKSFENPARQESNLSVHNVTPRVKRFDHNSVLDTDRDYIRHSVDREFAQKQSDHDFVQNRIERDGVRNKIDHGSIYDRLEHDSVEQRSYTNTKEQRDDSDAKWNANNSMDDSWHQDESEENNTQDAYYTSSKVC